LVILVAACKEREEIYFMASVGLAYSNPDLNSCGTVLYIDTDDNEETNNIGTHPINLPDTYQTGDIIYVQYESLNDTFDCQIFGPVVGSAFRSFPVVEILKIKE
jgi:hypothetical protein